MQNHDNPTPAECTGSGVLAIQHGSRVVGRRVTGIGPDRGMVDVTIERPFGRKPVLLRVAVDVAPQLVAALSGRPQAPAELGTPMPPQAPVVDAVEAERRMRVQLDVGEVNPSRTPDEHADARGKLPSTAYVVTNRLDRLATTAYVSRERAWDAMRAIAGEGSHIDGTMHTPGPVHAWTRDDRLAATFRAVPLHADVDTPHGLPVVALDAVTAALGVDAPTAVCTVADVDETAEGDEGDGPALCGDTAPGYPCVRDTDHHGHHRDKFGNHAPVRYLDEQGDTWESANDSGGIVRLVGEGLRLPRVEAERRYGELLRVQTVHVTEVADVVALSAPVCGQDINPLDTDTCARPAGHDGDCSPDPAYVAPAYVPHAPYLAVVDDGFSDDDEGDGPPDDDTAGALHAAEMWTGDLLDPAGGDE